jgi:hypothetical protein
MRSTHLWRQCGRFGDQINIIRAQNETLSPRLCRGIRGSSNCAVWNSNVSPGEAGGLRDMLCAQISVAYATGGTGPACVRRAG